MWLNSKQCFAFCPLGEQIAVSTELYLKQVENNKNEWIHAITQCKTIVTSTAVKSHSFLVHNFSGLKQVIHLFSMCSVHKKKLKLMVLSSPSYPELFWGFYIHCCDWPTAETYVQVLLLFGNQTWIKGLYWTLWTHAAQFLAVYKTKI